MPLSGKDVGKVLEVVFATLYHAYGGRLTPTPLMEGVRDTHTPTHQPLSGYAQGNGPRIPAPPYESGSCRVAASAILRHGLLSGR